MALMSRVDDSASSPPGGNWPLVDGFIFVTASRFLATVILCRPPIKRVGRQCRAFCLRDASLFIFWDEEHAGSRSASHLLSAADNGVSHPSATLSPCSSSTSRDAPRFEIRFKMRRWPVLNRLSSSEYPKLPSAS